MKTRRYLGAAALALVVCLSVSPTVSASPERDREIDPRQRVVRVIQAIKRFFGGVSVQEDTLIPPRP